MSGPVPLTGPPVSDDDVRWMLRHLRRLSPVRMRRWQRRIRHLALSPARLPIDGAAYRRRTRRRR